MWAVSQASKLLVGQRISLCRPAARVERGRLTVDSSVSWNNAGPCPATHRFLTCTVIFSPPWNRRGRIRTVPTRTRPCLGAQGGQGGQAEPEGLRRISGHDQVPLQSAWKRWLALHARMLVYRHADDAGSPQLRKGCSHQWSSGRQVLSQCDVNGLCDDAHWVWPGPDNLAQQLGTSIMPPDNGTHAPVQGRRHQ